MFCPNCGQERASTETSFCSRCGFLLTGTAELLQTGGIIPQINQQPAKGNSPRKKGLKQGLFIFLLTFLVVPIVAIFTIAINAEPFAVAISAIALFMGGLLRMAYALMFESTDPIDEVNVTRSRLHGTPQGQPVLPPQQTYPASSYASPQGRWRDTKDLEPTSVTESTTKLLEKEDEF